MDSACMFIPPEREDTTALRNTNELTPHFLSFLGKDSIKQNFMNKWKACVVESI